MTVQGWDKKDRRSLFIVGQGILQAKPIGFRGIIPRYYRTQADRAELVKSEEKYRTIIETMEEGYYEVDLKGKLTFVNEAMARMSGYSKSELLALNIRDYIDAETDQRLKQTYIRVFQTGEPCKGIEHEVICQDGTKKDHRSLHILGQGSFRQTHRVSGALLEILPKYESGKRKRPCKKARNVFEWRLNAPTILFMNKI